LATVRKTVQELKKGDKGILKRGIRGKSAVSRPLKVPWKTLGAMNLQKGNNNEVKGQ